MIRALTFSSRFLLRKVKEVNPQAGLLGEQPDQRGIDIDIFRRHYRRANPLNAGLERPNFQQHIHDLPTLQRNEIETRILRVFRDLQIIDLKSVNFAADLRRDLKLDSLNIVALLTSIEHEFTTVLEDNVFEGIKNLDELITILLRDPKII